MIDGSVHAGQMQFELQAQGYKKTDFDIRDFTEVMTYPVSGNWQQNIDAGIQEIIRSFSKAAFVHSLQKLKSSIRSSSYPRRCARASLNERWQARGRLFVESNNAIHVCNAPSPAATSSIEIGKQLQRS